MSTQVLLQNFPLTVIDLQQLQCLSYTSFITDLLKKLNENSLDRWTRAYLSRIEYSDSSIDVDIPDFIQPDSGDLIYQFDNNKGFTKGQLLYEIAKVLPKEVSDTNHIYWEGLVREGDHFRLRLS